MSTVVSSSELAARIAAADFSQCAATVVGYGNMGRQYVKALRALGVGNIRVCSHSEGMLTELEGGKGITTLSGGFESLDCRPQSEELGIIATPIKLLIGAAQRLALLGFRRLLIEKPVSLWADAIQRLSDGLNRDGVEIFCAYNRVDYPSFFEARMRTQEEGGITSCTYTFTELIERIDPNRHPTEIMARWGIANSLHVMSMAHGLIGLPAVWSGHRSGALAWHPSGAVFVGSGISDRGIPFSYHADWGSTGCWSVEAHTHVSSFRLCPLEKLFRRTSPMGEWQEVLVVTLAPQQKTGLAEQIAAMLSPTVRQVIPLFLLRDAVALTRFAEEILGYDNADKLASGDEFA